MRTGYSLANALLGLFDDYTEFGAKPNTKWLAMAYDVYAQDSWRPARDLTLELGLRYSLWQPWGTTNRAMASFEPQFYDPATAPVIDRAGGFVVSGDRFNGIVLPGDETDRRSARRLPAAGGHAAPVSRRAERLLRNAKDGFQPRVGVAYAINDVTTFRAGVGRFLNRVQINTTAAYGFNAPLSEMQTVINGVVDAPGGAIDAQLPAGDGDAVARLHEPDVVGLERDRRPRIALGDARHAVVRRPLGVAPRTGPQHQPAPAGNDPGQSRCERERASPVSGLRQHHAVRDDRHVQIQQPADAGRAAVDTRRRIQRGLYVLADDRRLAPAAATSCPNAMTTAAITVSRIWIVRTSWCRRYATASRRSRVTVAPMRWVLGNWDISGIFQAQSGAPFTVRTADDVAGVGPGSGKQF